MIERSVRHEAGMVECIRHEGEGCPRCDGSGMRPRRICAGCGESGRPLSSARSAESPEEAKALPRYCPECNPRRRGMGAALAALERMGA
jgi:hypothetical protein